MNSADVNVGILKVKTSHEGLTKEQIWSFVSILINAYALSYTLTVSESQLIFDTVIQCDPCMIFKIWTKQVFI